MFNMIFNHMEKAVSVEFCVFPKGKWELIIACSY